jgi:ABC-type lipoprotein release transport system permease subunit
MSFFDIFRLSLRNLREAKLRAILTTIGVIVGVAVIVTMVSFGLGLRRNTIERFGELDLFSEIEVYGRSVSALIAAQGGAAEGNDRGREGGRRRSRSSTRVLDDAALEEIARIPGVQYVEPNVSFVSYLRANNRVRAQLTSGVRVPNAASRFRNFSAGRMIGEESADEAIVDEAFLRNFGFNQPSEAVGQTVSLLEPRESGENNSRNPSEENNEAGEPVTFFGLPLGEEATGDSPESGLAARTFRIVGVLRNEIEGSDRRFRGMMPAANIYIPLGVAREWSLAHRSSFEEVALRVARESGAINEGETEGYPSATVRVGDPAEMLNVKRRLDEMNFNSFGLITELDRIQTFFIIINSALGLLGGISLLVASLGIANTMIMSILERTREIGIMKAIGAEDREVKLIFFVEAGVIGLTGGIIGVLAAWGIDTAANHLAYRFILKPRGEEFINFFALPPLLWTSVILFAIIIAILAALYPAARAARIDPVKALRHD